MTFGPLSRTLNSKPQTQQVQHHQPMTPNRECLSWGRTLANPEALNRKTQKSLRRRAKTVHPTLTRQPQSNLRLWSCCNFLIHFLEQSLARLLMVKWGLLGGSWVVISRVISPLIWVITIATLQITPLVTTHEPSSRVLGLGFRALTFFESARGMSH